MSRREFIKKSTAGLAAGFFAVATPDLLAQEKKPLGDIRIGVIGVGGRGTGLLRSLLGISGVRVTAVCDINEDHLSRALNIVEEAAGSTPVGFSKGPYDYRNMVERDDFDGVLIATPTKWHAEMSIDSMKAGKHVGSEVPGGYTVDEMWELVKTKEKSGKRYMLLENYNYMKKNMLALNMVKKGLFGEPYYAVGSYIHATPALNFNSDGSLTWRGELRRDEYGNWYPTHAIGPISKWLDINKGDAMDYLVCMQNKPTMAHIHAANRFGPDSPQAKIEFKTGEFIQTMIQTKKGKLMELDFGPVSPRPAQVYYGVQGTKGALDDRHGICIPADGGHDWKSIDKYRDEYNSPYWKRDGEIAGKDIIRE